MLGEAAAGRAHHARGVRVVEDHRRGVLARQLDDFGQAREVALHAEDPVRHDQLPRIGRAAFEAGPELVHGRVTVDHLARRAREPDRVDDARVVELVREDHRPLVGEARDHGLVGVPARDVGQRGLRSDQLRQLALELVVRLERAADEANGSGAGTVAAQALDPGLHDLGPGGKSQVVVRREDEHLAAAGHLDDRALGRAKRVEVLEGSGFAKRVELRAELAGERRLGHAHASASTAGSA